MSEEELDIQEALIKELQQCHNTLMVCAVEERNCRKCKERNLCLLYIRTVIANLYKLKIDEMSLPKKETPSGMYL